jgi:hypothetical protein
MRGVFVGFILGFVLKNKISQFGINIIKNGLTTFCSIKKNNNKQKTNKKITNIELVIKIKNVIYFRDLYKETISEKGVYKYTFPDEIIEYINNNINGLEIVLKDLCNLDRRNYDFDILSNLGTMYLYISYNLNECKYINVYTPESIIKEHDFITEIIPKKFSDIICSTVHYNLKTEYITQYFKKFFNQQTELTPEMILINYNKLDINLLNCKLTILDSTGKLIKYSITDKII